MRDNENDLEPRCFINCLEGDYHETETSSEASFAMRQMLRDSADGDRRNSIGTMVRLHAENERTELRAMQLARKDGN